MFERCSSDVPPIAHRPEYLRMAFHSKKRSRFNKIITAAPSVSTEIAVYSYVRRRTTSMTCTYLLVAVIILFFPNFSIKLSATRQSYYMTTTTTTNEVATGNLGNLYVHRTVKRVATCHCTTPGPYATAMLVIIYEYLYTSSQTFSSVDKDPAVALLL